VEVSRSTWEKYPQNGDMGFHWGEPYGRNIVEVVKKLIRLKILNDEATELTIRKITTKKE